MKNLIKKQQPLESIIDLTLPAFRSDESRVSDICQAILEYKPNGIKAYLDGFEGELKAEAESAFMDYAGALHHFYYGGAVKASEINDTLDKVTTPIETGLDATGVGHIPAWFLRAVQIIGPAAALYKQWESMEKSRAHFSIGYDAQKEYFVKSALGLGALELAELIPALGAFIGPGSDMFNLYVRNTNNLIARGVTPESFQAYLGKYKTDLYARMNGTTVINM